MRNRHDIEVIVREAEAVFWNKVAEQCPEIKTGDLDPMVAINLILHMEDTVASWIKLNSEGAHHDE